MQTPDQPHGRRQLSRRLRRSHFQPNRTPYNRPPVCYARFRTPGKDHALIGDVNRLDCQIQSHDADDRRPDRPLHQGDRQPGGQHQGEGKAGGPLAEPAVGKPPRAACRDCAGHACEAEEADFRMRERHGRGAQRQHHCGPEDAEGHEDQQCQNGAHTKKRLADKQERYRPQQLGIGLRRFVACECRGNDQASSTVIDRVSAAELR